MYWNRWAVDVGLECTYEDKRVKYNVVTDYAKLMDIVGVAAQWTLEKQASLEAFHPVIWRGI